MERNEKSDAYSRRKFMSKCIGGVAALSIAESVMSAAPDPETHGGGMFCTAGPNEEGVQWLESMHEAATDNSENDPYEVAERYGLTLIPRGVIQEFIDNELHDTDSPWDAVTKINDLSEQWLGFPVSINLYATEQEASYALEDADAFKTSLSKLLINISLLPKEFYQSIKFTGISLEDIPGVGGDYTYSTGIIRFDLGGFSDATLAYHELGHAINMTGCGEFEDTAFTGSLPEGIEYGDDWQGVENLDDIFVSAYGMQNDKEDSAMVTAAWMTGQIGLSDDLKGTPLYDKLTIVMDRFETLVPGMVGYVEEGLRPAFLRKA